MCWDFLFFYWHASQQIICSSVYGTLGMIQDNIYSKISIRCYHCTHSEIIGFKLKDSSNCYSQQVCYCNEMTREVNMSTSFDQVSETTPYIEGYRDVIDDETASLR